MLYTQMWPGQTVHMESQKRRWSVNQIFFTLHICTVQKRFQIQKKENNLSMYGDEL